MTVLRIFETFAAAAPTATFKSSKNRLGGKQDFASTCTDGRCTGFATIDRGVANVLCGWLLQS
jgi:hypothetical protein